MPSTPSDELVTFLARWALVHDMADEAWRAAVARGKAATTPREDDEPVHAADLLAALVAGEKDRLAAQIEHASTTTERTSGTTLDVDGVRTAIDGLRIEVATLRGRIESMEASLDAMLATRED